MSKKKKQINKQIKNLFEDIQYEEPKTDPIRKDVELSGQEGELMPSEITDEPSESAAAEAEMQGSGGLDLQEDVGESDPSGAPEDGGPSETTTGEAEMQSLDALDLQEDGGESDSGGASEAGPEEDLSPDELLEGVRHSLITDSNVKEEAEQSKWWRRIFKGRRRKTEEVEAPEAMSAPVPLSMFVESAVNEGADGDGQEEYVEQLDELIDMLEDDVEKEPVLDDVPAVETVAPETEQQEQAIVDLNELKKRVFHARSTNDEAETSFSEVRSVALDEGEEVFVEVESKAENQGRDRMKAAENALRPFRRYFYFIFVFVSLVMVLLVSVSLYRVYLRSLPPPQVEEVVQLPYPVGMNLPGGLSFRLGRGSLKDGRWDPVGPEWLEGTEVCRWIAIPHSRQLEAVVRTLTRDDKIELVISNNDILTYTVSSIDQLSLDEMQKLDSDTPCMLLVLAQSGTEERWVVTALP